MNDAAKRSPSPMSAFRGWVATLHALVRRAIDWADRHEIPVYSHMRGLWLLARSLRVQADDRLPAGARDGFVQSVSPPQVSTGTPHVGAQ
jgi:hypothetical protein